MLRSDVICALATPAGAAGLAVVRLSGAGCFALADACFRGSARLADAPARTFHYGTFWRGELALDAVVASVFRAPHSYTGEDSVEFACHGGVIVSNEIVEALLEAGARHAEPGEFTKRAFLNGKMDLTQAEAVGDLIHAVSTRGSHAAARQMLGGLTKKLNELREELLRLCGLLELELDFAQEDLEFVQRDRLEADIQSAIRFCEELSATHRASEILRSGYAVGIAGYPNAGKSSLLNALLQRERALVSAAPGTTRDYIEEALWLNGLLVRLIDTAGLRPSADAIEIAGIRLAETLFEQCNLILVINDASLSRAHSERLTGELSAKFPLSDFALVHNKIDVAPPESVQGEFLETSADESAGMISVLSVSAQTGEGVEGLKRFLHKKAAESAQGASDALLNARQAALLRQSAAALRRASEAARAGVSNEFAAIDLREALGCIGEITGAVWNEDILNAVFAKFCIGK